MNLSKHDHPWVTICKAMELLAGKGYDCYQKFSCEECGNRLTMPTANHIYKTGDCDKCGHTSNIQENGCNYMLHASNKSLEEINKDQKWVAKEALK